MIPFRYRFTLANTTRLYESLLAHSVCQSFVVGGLEHHALFCYMGVKSFPLVRTSLLSTLSSGLQTLARNARLLKQLIVLF